MAKGRAKRRAGATAAAKHVKGAGRPGRRARKQPETDAPAVHRPDDVYEAEERAADEERFVYRFDDVDNYEYELPSDFEDEEIDEDEAFNSEDERKYGAWFERDGGARQGDDVPSEEDDDPEGDMLMESSEEEGMLDAEESGGSDDMSEHDDEEDKEEEEDQDDSFEDEQDSGAAAEVDALLDEVFGGSSDPGSSDEGDDDDDDHALTYEQHGALLRAVRGQQGGAARQVADPNAAVRSEAYTEGEHNLNPGGAAGGALCVTDLIAGLGERAGQLGSARKTLEKLSTKGGPVQAPLPAVVRDRQTRKAGYQEAKKDVGKWQPIVQANREAPTLRFDDGRADLPQMSTTAALAAAFVPSTPLEEQVAALLAKAKANDAKAVAEAEEQLAVRTMTPQELAARQEQLARMRSVLFHHERRLKRLAKIKSKDYRRRLKKAAQKQAAKSEDGTMDDAAMREAAEEAEFQRAKERLTLKHKNSSRWARRALRRGVTVMDQNTREALAEQLRLGQEIRQRVNSLGRPRNSDDEDTDATDATSDNDDAADPQTRTRTATLDVLLGDDVPEEVPTKGLFSLPFMQRAMQRKQSEVKHAAEKLLQDLGDKDGVNKSAQGRMRFDTTANGGWGDDNKTNDDSRSTSPSSDEEENEQGGNEDEDAEARAQRLGKESSVTKQAPTQKPAAKLGAVSATVLTAALTPSPSTTVGRVINKVAAKAPATPPQPSSIAGDFVPAAAFAGARAGYVFTRGAQGVGYYKDTTSAGHVQQEPQQSQQGNGVSKRKHADKYSSEDDDVDSDDSEDAAVPSTGVSKRQRALIQQAFAGDDVAADFAKEKAAEVDAEHPMPDTPSLLPGWGAWAGQRKKTPQWIVDAQDKATKQRDEAKARRKDAGLDHVVISERWDKKAAKYMTQELPFPFKDKVAYERSMRQPLGKDFNTDESFRNLTRPAVLKKPGVIIKPAQFSKAMADELRERPTVVSKKKRVAVMSGGKPKRVKG